MIREIIVKAVHRTSVPCTFIANRVIPLPKLPTLRMQTCLQEADAADHLLLEQACPGDFAITQDIPLANDLVNKGVITVNPYGKEYTSENVKQRLNMRDFFETMRASGAQTSGPAPINEKDKQRFANALDRWLTKSLS